ncbi:MAG: ferrous iron transport protein A [Erysipelothrix sp.]|uniref:FeoA family protein n=1 Tax=Desulfitibacter alkalitolerans TaxID=264641 RepID=UPI00048079C1|nr:FeoA family protein [Desulfitibacter alkalitolerans]MBS3987027.1 ferrous iron transport protein A [Erysipelothrix sp.]
MMPLSLLRIGDKVVLKEITADHGVKKALLDRGLIRGTTLKVLASDTNGSYILYFGGTRLAVDKELAKFILVESYQGGKFDEKTR